MARIGHNSLYKGEAVVNRARAALYSVRRRRERLCEVAW